MAEKAPNWSAGRGFGVYELLLSWWQHRASFLRDLVRTAHLLPSEVEDGLWELAAAGLVTADGFENMRALIDPKRRNGEGRGRTQRPRHAAGPQRPPAAYR